MIEDEPTEILVSSVASQNIIRDALEGEALLRSGVLSPSGLYGFALQPGER